ncbi:MAG: hemerythrin domain-containing protein [Promethearchaeati archaeon SRVP18_Atabeyarchaeia-1]
MKPIGPLMIEHRLIERMIAIVKEELNKIERGKKADPIFIDTYVDFARTYADRCHHGKEEDILFRDLAKKKLSPGHKKTVDELVEEHVYARKTVGELVAAKDKYVQGNSNALKEITAKLGALAEFYPKHIEKEDKHFFFPILDYFTKQEQDAMLQEFWEFDRKLIHEKYQKIVERFETK